MNESRVESSELEAEIMASFLLRPVIVHLFMHLVNMKSHVSFWILIDKNRGMPLRIFIQNLGWMALLKANYYWFLDKLTFMSIIGS